MWNLATIYLPGFEVTESIATELSDKKRIPIYNLWSRSLNIGEEELSTEVSVLGMPSTSATYDNTKFRVVAEEWKKMEEPAFGNLTRSFQPPSTKPRRVAIAFFPDNIDNDAIDFCVENSLFGAVQEYYQCLLTSFKHLGNVKVMLSRDNEILDSVKMRFVINIKNDDIDGVLADEDNFNQCVRQAIGQDFLSLLVSTVQLTKG